MTLSNPFLLPVDPRVSRAFRGSFEPHIGFVKQMFHETVIQSLCGLWCSHYA